MGELRRSDSPNLFQAKTSKIARRVKSRAGRNTDSSEPATKPSAGGTWEAFRRDGLFASVGRRRTLFLLCDSQAFSGSDLSGVDDRNRLSSHPSTNRKPHPAQEFGRSDLYHPRPCYCFCADVDLGSPCCPRGPWVVYPAKRQKRGTGWLESIRYALRRSSFGLGRTLR